MSIFDVIKGAAGALPVIGGTVSGVLDAGGALVTTVSGGQRSILSPCPGTPPGLAQAVADRLRAMPEVETALRQFIASNPPPDKDFQQLRSVWATVEGLAAGAVWTAWGGGDCKTSSRETPLQNELRRIAALPLPSAGGGLSLSTTAVLGNGSGGLSPVALIGIALVLGAGVFLLARK